MIGFGAECSGETTCSGLSMTDSRRASGNSAAPELFQGMGKIPNPAESEVIRPTRPIPNRGPHTAIFDVAINCEVQVLLCETVVVAQDPINLIDNRFASL